MSFCYFSVLSLAHYNNIFNIMAYWTVLYRHKSVPSYSISIVGSRQGKGFHVFVIKPRSLSEGYVPGTQSFHMNNFALCLNCCALNAISWQNRFVRMYVSCGQLINLYTFNLYRRMNFSYWDASLNRTRRYRVVVMYNHYYILVDVHEIAFCLRTDLLSCRWYIYSTQLINLSVYQTLPLNKKVSLT